MPFLFFTRNKTGSTRTIAPKESSYKKGWRNMKRNEKQTREELIDPKLHFAGLFDNLQIVSLLTDLESLL